MSNAPLICQLFPEDLDIKECSNGTYKTECPCCGLQGGRTQGFILFPETNTWYCHGSGKHGGMLELIAMQNKLIRCIDCLESNEKGNILNGSLFPQTLQFLEENYDEKLYSQIYDFLNIKKEIRIPGNNRLISDFSDELSIIFKNKLILFFRPDIREIVEIGKSERCNNITDNNFLILKPTRFITILEKYFKPFTYNQKGDKIDKSLTTAIASVVLTSPHFQDNLYSIERILPVQIPLLYEKKLTFPKSGYDKRFKTWLPYNSPCVTNYDMSLDEAKDIINTIYSGFCFQSEQDRTNAIAAMITPYLKGIFTNFNVRTPVFFYVANRERAGKDYCAGVTGIIYEGQAIEENPISTSEKGGNSNDELRKSITSAMIQGRKRFHSSNNKGLINNAVFESATTNSVWTDRILGKNEKVIFSNELDFSMSGNIGTKLTPDLANRSIYINLFLDIEDANERVFKIPNLHGWVLENRDLILSAIYCLIKNWFNHNCPKGSAPFTSFQEWAEICGGIMECANIGNPCIKSKQTFGISLDNETEDMKELFELCYELKPNEWITKTDIKEIIKNSELFTYYDFDNNKSDQTKFGKKLDKFCGRVLSSIKFDVKDMNIRASRREYKFVKMEKNIDKIDKKLENLGNVGNLGNVWPTSICFAKENNIGIPSTSPKSPTLPKKPKNKKIIKIQKSDREIQFWDAEECKNIKPIHTPFDVKKFLKTNPGSNFEQLVKYIGVGCAKFIVELLKKEEIIEKDNKYYLKDDKNGK